MQPIPEQMSYEHKRDATCSVQGCTTAIKARGMCSKHYKRNTGATCSVQGCTTATKARGMCGKHGNKRCSFSGCATAAQDDVSGLCNHHGGGRRCTTPGCTKNAKRNTKCIRHQPASSLGCSQIPQSKGIRKPRGGTCTHRLVTRPPPATATRPPAIEQMQALTCNPRYSGPSWPEICAMLRRAHHVQPTSSATTHLMHMTPTQVPTPDDHDHVMVAGFGIRLSDSPGPGISPLQ